MRTGSFGWYPRARLRVDFQKLVVKRSEAALLYLRGELRAHCLVLRQVLRERARERAVIKGRAADEQRHAPARDDSPRRAVRVLREVRGGINFVRVRNVYQVVMISRRTSRETLSVPDVEIAVDLPRVDGDDLGVQLLREREAELRLADGGRPYYRDYRNFSFVIFQTIPEVFCFLL